MTRLCLIIALLTCSCTVQRHDPEITKLNARIDELDQVLHLQTETIGYLVKTDEILLQCASEQQARLDSVVQNMPFVIHIDTGDWRYHLYIPDTTIYLKKDTIPSIHT
jgi:hypothetical protein